MNSEISLVKKNTFYSTITIFSRLFANVFIFWLLARFYGPEQFGVFTFAHALATTFIILADFGLDVLLITEIASNPDKRKEIIDKLFGIKLIFVLLAFFVMLIVSQLFPIGSKYFVLILVFGFYLVFTSLNNFMFGIFRGFEKFLFETRVAFISNVFLIFVSIIFLYLKVDLIFIAFLFMFMRVFGTVLSFIYLRKVYKNFKLDFNFSNLGILKSKSLIFGLHLIFSYLFFQVDTLLLAKIIGEYAVGIYQSVIKLIMLPLVIPDIFNNSLLPTLSRLYNNSETDWLKLGGLMGKILIIIIIPVTLFSFFYASEIINLIYGSKKFSDAVFVLQIFGFILFIRFLLEPFALMLTTSNRQRIRLYTVILATLLNVSLNIYFIPRFGVNGAAIVSLVVNSFVGFVYFWLLRRDFTFWLFDFKNLVLIVFSILIITLLQYYFSINFLLKILLFTSVYILFIVVFYLKKSEQEILMSILKKFPF